MRRKLVLLALLLAFLLQGRAQQSMLQSGPMVGYSTMKEVLLWVQTTAPAKVKFAYWEKNLPKQKKFSDTYTTTAEHAYTAHVPVKVEEGKVYDYQLYINNKPIKLPYVLEFQSQKLWQWRESPPTFTFALGSCAYINEPPVDRPGEPYGGGYEIFGNILKKNPDFMLWLGDNVYLREADWNSQTGIFHRYTHTRSLPELQPLLASVHHYAIWDDHDYGPNDSDRSYWGKEMTTEAFKLFWANPNYNLTNKGGITGTFQWADVQFFLLDDRYHKTPNDRKTGERHILGEEQLQWLIDALTYSNASFKFVVIGGQVLNPAEVFENYATYPEERRKLISLIQEEKIPGVIFLTGDRHHTILTKLDEEDSVPLYDLTVSPLTSGAGRGADEGNYLAVDGTFVNERNFGLIKVFGDVGDRKLLIIICNESGKELWKKEISQKELTKN